MDISDFRKHAIPQIEAGRKIDAIRQVIRRERYADRDKRESLKESFKPITDKLEEETGELTDEIKDLKMLPAPRSSTPAQLSIEASSSSTLQAKAKKVTETLDLDGGLSEEGLKLIHSYGFPMPSELYSTRNPNEVKDMVKRARKILQSLGGKKSNVKDMGKVRELDDKMDTLRSYKNLISTFPKAFELPKHKAEPQDS